MSVLSAQCDGCGFYYGFAQNDYRQINVRPAREGGWEAFVGGVLVAATMNSKAAAEAAALKYIDDNPVARSDEEE
jgi:hypothetical protein